jgi:hypothetical protein
MVDHDSIVQAAGTLRRIANRLTEISMGRIRAALSRLDDATEAAPVAILAAIRARLETWLEFIEERSGLHQCQASNRVRQSFAQRNPPTPGRIQSAGCATIARTEQTVPRPRTGVGWALYQGDDSSVTGLPNVEPTFDRVRLSQRLPVPIILQGKDLAFPFRMGATAVITSEGNR